MNKPLVEMSECTFLYGYQNVQEKLRDHAALCRQVANDIDQLLETEDWSEPMTVAEAADKGLLYVPE